MPNVYNVSEITTLLSGTIQKEDVLQNVRVQGKVSVERRSNVFFLKDEENKIRCFIPDGKTPKFKSLLKAGNIVIVKGNIDIFAIFSEYQIRVKDVQLPGINRASTVSRITQQLSGIIEDTPELSKIQVQGKISGLAYSGVTSWDFRDAGNQRIRCFSNLNNAIPVDNGDEVQIQGKIEIYGPRSQYQITVEQIEHNDALCQCPGCRRCGNSPQCNRPREVANFGSCATGLPRPPDELYELCPECYAISPDHETKVAEAVYAYFHELQVNGFSPYIHIRNARNECKECQIQFGARNGIADVVLADGNGSFAAIAECKGAGYVGHGIEQLKSYLSATDTRFGVFANRVDKSQWKLYENRRGNCIPEIDCSEFKAGVVEGVANRERLIDEIANLNGEIAGLENQKSELHNAIRQVSQTKRNLIERTSNLTQQIEELENYKSGLHEETYQKLDELVEKKMQRLERSLSVLKIELQKRGIVNWFKNLFSKENK